MLSTIKTVNQLRKNLTCCFLILFAFLAFSCEDNTEDNALPAETVTFDFKGGATEWEGGFADYPKEWDTTRFEFVCRHADLPAEVNRQGKGILISGRNISDDLFMFMKKQITGLEPNHTYQVTK
ncbi:hypothetical protein ACXYMU_11250 [Pontibacter sp. CAU 1760]